jgi:uncharacterized protein YbaR (Trm112 family)
LLTDELLHILVCPRCRGELRPDERREMLECVSCKRRFAVERGIPIMIESDERPES